MFQEKTEDQTMAIQGEAFAKNLKARRRELGLTQKDLADQIGYSEKSVSKWENGFSIAPSAILPLLAKKLETSIDALLSENSEQRYFLGIDGGGTKTEFALSDEDGTILYRAILDGSNPVDIGIDKTLDILADGISAVCGKIPNSKISVFAGISGGITGDYKNRIHEFLNRYNFADAKNGSDAENAVAIALGERNGTAIIMGTGSIAFTKTNGTLTRNGGYGFFFDDGGSGFSIGRDAVIAALTAEEGRGIETVLLPMLKEKLGCERLIDALGALYKGGKRIVASFAPLVFNALKAGDEAAEAIIDSNMRAIASLIDNAPLTENGRHRVVIVGGLANEFDIIEPYIKKYVRNAESLDISANTSAPIYGALMLAGARQEKEKY